MVMPEQECKACDEYNRVKKLLGTSLTNCCGNLSMVMANLRQDHIGKAQIEVRALQSNLADVMKYLAALMELKKEKTNEQARNSANS